MKYTLNFACGLLLLAVSAQGKVVVTHPTVERRTEPLGLDVVSPRLGWQIESNQKSVVVYFQHLVRNEMLKSPK